MKNKLQIIRIAKEKQITTLFHFTKLTNLNSIFTHGILSRKTMEYHNIKFDFSDEYRYDNCFDGISVSISYPNGRMLYCKSQVNNYAILVLNPRVLQLDCSFLPTNAAKSELRNIIRNKKSPDDFKAMFSTYPPFSPYSRNPHLPTMYPTDEQAEILVFDPIPTSFIEGIIFKSNKDYLAVRTILKPEIDAYIDDRYFSIRDYTLKNESII